MECFPRRLFSGLLRAALTARRPTDLAWALVAPLAIGLAVIGVVTTVFPGFLGT